MKVGELVIVQDDDIKRGKWPLARVIRVMPGRDGIVRVAEIKTRSGVYTRPTSKLLTLEDTVGDVSQGGGEMLAKRLSNDVLPRKIIADFS